jgi:hypothetical protein
MHNGGDEKAINFDGFGSVPVVAFGTIGRSAVSERGAIGIDVGRCRRVHAGRFGVDGDIIIGQSKRSGGARRHRRPPLE